VNRRDLALIQSTRAALADGSAKRQRAQAGVRQVELAALLKVAQSTVSQWENGVRVPAADDALAYGRALAALARLAARAEVAADGRWLGGKRPFGWEPDPAPLGDDGEPLLDDDGLPVKGVLRLRQSEADALAGGLRAVLAGATLASISRDWNARGILTSQGNQWHPREVGRVLRRPRNAGLMEHQGRITGQAQWPAVVDEPTWRGAAAILGDPARRTTPGPASRHLLSWIARCGVRGCGGPVICTSSSRASGAGRRLVYRCREGARGHLSRDKAALDAMVEALVIGRMSRDDAGDLLVKPEDGDGLTALVREKVAVTEAMAADRRLHLAGVITEAEFVAGRRKYQADLEAVNTRITEAARADVLAPMIGDPAAAWEGMDLDQRRAVVSRLMTIRLMPAPKGRPAGWRPGEPYFSPRSVEIVWRDKPAGNSPV
jgi:transcriptional regulator with XRE-family HTH domain